MLRVKTLGCLAVAGREGPVAGAAGQPRRMAMLALLARAGQRGMTRDKLVSLLWPDAEEEKGRRNLANALSALRRDLGADDAFAGSHDLRLNPERLSSDVAEFEAALATGRLEQAVELYAGPFLDGFRLSGLGEFERWTTTEREALAHDYQEALERLARAAGAREDHPAAARWWRKLTGHDPLSGRYAVGLMQALAATGDRASALRHAQQHETLVKQELGVRPEPEVVALALRLREVGENASVAGADPPRPPDPPAMVAPDPMTATPIPAQVEPRAPAQPRWPPRALWRLAGAVLVVPLLVVTGLLLRGRRSPAAPPDARPVIAIGRINDHRPDQSIELTKPLTDMLATGLAQVPGIRVVSTARMYELLARSGGVDTSAGAITVAARRAGASELLQGALFPGDAGSFRLDLQRVDLTSGEVRAVYSVSGASAFVLADSGIGRFLAELRMDPPVGSVADVTTQSLAAYRMYEEGLRAYYQGDWSAAMRLFAAAVTEDSGFAAAAFYRARSAIYDPSVDSRALLQRASRLAVHAPDRERLIIQAYWALATVSPAAGAIAETLAVRYPHEVEGHLLTGMVRNLEGRDLESVPYFERVVAMDSLSLRGARLPCQACDAFDQLVSAYLQADSLELAERTARRWIRLQPESGVAWGRLAEILAHLGRADSAIAALQNQARLGAADMIDIEAAAYVNLQTDRLAAADQALEGLLTTGNPARRSEAHWYLTISKRMQGQLGQALDHARSGHRLLLTIRPASVAPDADLQLAQVLFEQARFREAAAMFESMSRWTPPLSDPSYLARHRSWSLTLAANALAYAGDTVGLGGRADTVERLAAQTSFRANQRLHHHIRGLLHVARGRDEEAIREFRRGILSPNMGFTRTNYELARSLLRRGRPAEAVPVLQAALRGGIDGRNLYLSRTELHELLAQAWHAVGGPGSRDSMEVHYRQVVAAWSTADPSFRPRVDAAKRALSGDPQR